MHSCFARYMNVISNMHLCFARSVYMHPCYLKFSKMISRCHPCFASCSKIINTMHSYFPRYSKKICHLYLSSRIKQLSNIFQNDQTCLSKNFKVYLNGKLYTSTFLPSIPAFNVIVEVLKNVQ